MKNKKPTFSDILKQTARTNSETLMAKARTANRVAKRSRGRNRRKAYEVKAKILKFLVENMPNKIRVSEDFRLTEFVVISLEKESSGLHTPISNLQRF
ncbi:MAG: hypothetical protein ACR2MD_08255 [Aridibacter sp.]